MVQKSTLRTGHRALLGNVGPGTACVARRGWRTGAHSAANATTHAVEPPYTPCVPASGHDVARATVQTPRIFALSLIPYRSALTEQRCKSGHRRRWHLSVLAAQSLPPRRHKRSKLTRLGSMTPSMQCVGFGKKSGKYTKYKRPCTFD